MLKFNYIKSNSFRILDRTILSKVHSERSKSEWKITKTRFWVYDTIYLRLFTKVVNSRRKAVEANCFLHVAYKEIYMRGVEGFFNPTLFSISDRFANTLNLDPELIYLHDLSVTPSDVTQVYRVYACSLRKKMSEQR